MAAEIVWREGRTGVLRYGPFFRSAEDRDRYDGCGTVSDHGDWCEIGPIGGAFTPQDWEDILDACRGWGFGHAEFERHGKRYAVELVRPYRMRRKV